MTEMIPGINRFKIPIPNNPLENTNCYLVQGDDGYLLIDPGVNNDGAFNALEKGLNEIGVAFAEITRILATHSHGDHYGLTGRIKELSQAKIMVHHLVRDQIQSMTTNFEERGQQMEQWLRLNGVPNLTPSEFQMIASRLPWFTNSTMPDVVLQDGETINVGSFSFKVVWTPGHDPGHICLYESSQKILFSGDHVLPSITPHVAIQSQNQSRSNPLGDFLNSLNVVKQLDVDIVLPAHENTFTNLQTRIEEIVEHHETRNAEILTAIKNKAKTTYEISTEITWMRDVGGKAFHELPPGDKRMAVSEALAHMEAMRIDGRVDKLLRDSTIYYQRT